MSNRIASPIFTRNLGEFTGRDQGSATANNTMNSEKKSRNRHSAHRVFLVFIAGFCRLTQRGKVFLLFSR